MSLLVLAFMDIWSNPYLTILNFYVEKLRHLKISQNVKILDIFWKEYIITYADQYIFAQYIFAITRNQILRYLLTMCAIFCRVNIRVQTTEAKLCLSSTIEITQTNINIKHLYADEKRSRRSLSQLLPIL